MNARPRKFDVSDKLIMGNMADLMVRELWGAYEHEHKQRVMQLTRVVGCFSEPLLFVEASQTQPWVILHLNEAAVTVTGQISGWLKASLEWITVCVLCEWAASCFCCMPGPCRYILGSSQHPGEGAVTGGTGLSAIVPSVWAQGMGQSQRCC